MESGVGGKTYNIIKSLYTNNKCEVKIGKKHTFLSTWLWGEAGMQLKHHPLQHISMNWRWQSAAPGLTLLESDVKCVLFVYCVLFADQIKSNQITFYLSHTHG